LKEITLNDNELYAAGMVGVRRRVESIKRRLSGTTAPNASGKFRSEVPWDSEIEGVAGEVAVAKALQLYWGFDVNTFKDPDVGPYQVRTTDSIKKSMIMRPKDSSEEIYILVAGRTPKFTVIGWIYGFDAKRDEYWGIRGSGGDPAWWIPVAHLHPIETLPSPDEARAYKDAANTKHELYSAAQELAA